MTRTQQGQCTHSSGSVCRRYEGNRGKGRNNRESQPTRANSKGIRLGERERVRPGAGHLGVVPGLQGLSIICLPSVLGLSNEIIQAVIDDSQISVELALAWHQILGEGQVPIGDVECGSVLCLFQHPIDCLHLP